MPNKTVKTDDTSELLRPNQRLEAIASWEECIVSR